MNEILKEMISSKISNYYFEINNEETRRKITSDLNDIVENKYRVVCDEKLNTEEIINQNSLVVEILDKEKTYTFTVNGKLIDFS